VGGATTSAGVTAAPPGDASRRPRHERGKFRYGGVLLLTLAVAVFALTAPEGRGSRAIEQLAAGATLVVAVVTSRAPRRTRRVVGSALVVALVITGAGAATGVTDPAVAFAVTAATLAATAGVIVVGMLRLVFDRGVVVQSVLGAVTIYVLLGLTFAFIIGTIADAVNGPFFASGTDGVQTERVYYSFTVLTTTGFGDFTALNRGGRALAVLEMLIGQIYLVTVIATLVGNLRRRPS
jgi:Ion channel